MTSNVKTRHTFYDSSLYRQETPTAFQTLNGAVRLIRAEYKVAATGTFFSCHTLTTAANYGTQESVRRATKRLHEKFSTLLRKRLSVANRLSA